MSIWLLIYVQICLFCSNFFSVFFFSVSSSAFENCVYVILISLMAAFRSDFKIQKKNHVLLILVWMWNPYWNNSSAAALIDKQINIQFAITTYILLPFYIFFLFSFSPLTCLCGASWRILCIYISIYRVAIQQMVNFFYFI